MINETNDITFHEEQRFGLWIRLLVIIAALGSIGLAFCAKTLDEVFTSPQIILVIFTGLLLPVFIAIFFCMIKLQTQVCSDGLYVRFFPIHIRFKKFNSENIDQYYVRTYRPLMEYGGWGIRFGKNGKAYNIRGRQGLQLVLKNNKKLLIGSGEPEKIVEAMKVFMEKTD